MEDEDKGWTYTIEDFESICNADDLCRAYRRIFTSILRDVGRKVELVELGHYIIKLCLGLCYDLIERSPYLANNGRSLDAAYAQLVEWPSPGDIWHRQRSKSNPDVVTYFRESPDGSGEHLQERPVGVKDEDMIDVGFDEILSGRQELVVIASLLKGIKNISDFKDVIVLLEVLASMAYRASDPNYNLRVWRSCQTALWHAIEVGDESPVEVYERFRYVVKSLRSVFGADAYLAGVTDAIGRLLKALDAAKPNAETAPSLDLLMRLASWDTHEPASDDNSPSTFLKSVAATLIILGDQVPIREIAEELLAEGDELVEKALDSDAADFLDILYDATPPLTAAELLFDALGGLPRLTTESPDQIVLELRSALDKQDQQFAARNRSVADETVTRVGVSISRNALDLSKERHSRTLEELRRAYREGGKTSARQLVGQLIEYEFTYPRILAEELLARAMANAT